MFRFKNSQPDDEDDAFIGGSARRPLREDEFPDADEQSDDEDSDTLPCPHCKHPILEDSPWCPHCGNYLHREGGLPGRAPWITVTLIVVVLLLVIATVLTR